MKSLEKNYRMKSLEYNMMRIDVNNPGTTAEPAASLLQKKMKVAASLLACDFSQLAKEIRRVEQAGIDFFHIDVMDGHFVPNIAIGIPIIHSIRKTTNLIFEVHLMVENPERFIEPVAAAGADILGIHIESCAHPYRTIKLIKSLGVKAAIAINPSTSLDQIKYLLPEIDTITVMTVDPGFGGQTFKNSLLGKISELKRMITDLGKRVEIEIDGGVNFSNIHSIWEAGADIVVLGNLIFSSKFPREIISQLKTPNNYLPKGVIFDFDGVVIDSERYQLRAFNYILSQHKQKTLKKADFVKFVGRRAKDIWDEVKGSIDLSSEELVLIKEKIYLELILNDNVKPMPGLVKLLRSLQKNHWQLAIASSSPEQTIRLLLGKLQLTDYFPIVVSGNNVNKSKPAPDIFNLTVSMMGLNKNQVIAIEDSFNGLRAAKSAGIRCVIAYNEYTKYQDFSTSDMRFKSLTKFSNEDAINLLSQINQEYYA